MQEETLECVYNDGFPLEALVIQTASEWNTYFFEAIRVAPMSHSLHFWGLLRLAVASVFRMCWHVLTVPKILRSASPWTIHWGLRLLKFVGNHVYHAQAEIPMFKINLFHPSLMPLHAWLNHVESPFFSWSNPDFHTSIPCFLLESPEIPRIWVVHAWNPPRFFHDVPPTVSAVSSSTEWVSARSTARAWISASRAACVASKFFTTLDHGEINRLFQWEFQDPKWRYCTI